MIWSLPARKLPPGRMWIFWRIRTVLPHVRLIIITRKSSAADEIAAMRERAFSYFS